MKITSSSVAIIILRIVISHALIIASVLMIVFGKNYWVGLVLMIISCLLQPDLKSETYSIRHPERWIPLAVILGVLLIVFLSPNFAGATYLIMGSMVLNLAVRLIIDIRRVLNSTGNSEPNETPSLS